MANPVMTLEEHLRPVDLPMTVEHLDDREEICAYLMRDRYAHAYLLGNLDAAYLPFCRWYGTRGQDGTLQNVILIYQGLSLPVVFMIGSEANWGCFLADCRRILPERFQFHVSENRVGELQNAFHLSSVQKLHRMGLQRSSYRRVKHDVATDRLGHRDTAAIMELYAHYPDHFFEPYQLETGLYFGVRDADAGLVSIAGVHVVSSQQDVAVIGNLVTHPEFRGHGYASACTGRLLDELFERVSFVALNVQTDNEPAIRMYQRFGFEPNNIFYEGRCTKNI